MDKEDLLGHMKKKKKKKKKKGNASCMTRVKSLLEIVLLSKPLGHMTAIIVIQFFSPLHL